MTEEKDILIDGLKVNLKTAGEGEPLLILHGWGSSSDSWKEVQKILAEKGYKVIIPDFPGFGKSITPPRAWGVKDYSNFILNLTKKLEISQFFLLGHSFGGRVAIKFAKQYPEKIKYLILCSSAGIKAKPGFKTRLIYLIAKTGNALFSRKLFVRFKDRARNFFYIFLSRKDYIKADGIMKKTIRRVLEEDLLLDLPLIKNKTLIVWGEADSMVPLKYAYIFKEKIRDSRLKVLSKIGHSPHLEATEKLAEIILNFLNE